ncbi:hypothetical protein ACWFRC_07520 [Bacillus cereus]
MKIEEQAQKYYKGNLIFFDDAQEQIERFGSINQKEEWLMNLYPFSDEILYEEGDCKFAVLDDVNTLKNLMVFAEINRYKETLFSDMDDDERDKTIQLIINNLGDFHVKPIGYEIKYDSIIVAWYLNSVINTFTFSDQVTGLVNYYSSRTS